LLRFTSALAPLGICLTQACGSDAVTANVTAVEAPALDAGAVDGTSPPADAANDMNTSEANCGWQGHSCQGLGCRDGVCNSELVAKVCPTSGCARDDMTVTGIAVEGETVAWAHSGVSLGQPSGTVYWKRRGAIESQNLGDKAVGLMAMGEGFVSGEIRFPATLRDVPTGSAGAVFPYKVDPLTLQNFRRFGSWVLLHASSDVYAVDLTSGQRTLVVQHLYNDTPAETLSHTFDDFAQVDGAPVVLVQQRSTIRREPPPAAPERTLTYAIAKTSTPGGLADVTLAKLALGHYSRCLTGSSSGEAIFADASWTSRSNVLRTVHAVSLSGQVRQLGSLPAPVRDAQFREFIPGTLLTDGDSVFVSTSDGVFRGSLTRAGAFVRATPEPSAGDTAQADSCQSLATDARFLYYYVQARGEIRRVAK
jgi:hypothetical protein